MPDSVFIALALGFVGGATLALLFGFLSKGAAAEADRKSFGIIALVCALISLLSFGIILAALHWST